jgi:large-conductance mechanosensitive channel
MASIILSQTIDTQQVLGNFRDFLVNNGVLTMASGIIIGISTTLFIKSLVSDMVLPLLYILLFGWVKFISPDTSKILKGVFLNTEFRWRHTIQNIITWLVIIFVAFLILEYLVRRSFLRKFYETQQKNSVTEEEKPIFKMANIPNIPELAVRNIRNDMVDRSSLYVMQHYP